MGPRNHASLRENSVPDRWHTVGLTVSFLAFPASAKQAAFRDDPATVEKLAKNKQRPISYEAGERLARELRAVKYVECSALTQVRTLSSY